MNQRVKTYAERSAERPAEPQEPWERSMRSLIIEHFEAIEKDVRIFGTVRVIKDLEAERQDHFDAFLNERERRAKARLERNPLDAEADRQLEWIENARRKPPFQPFRMNSFSQALHLERKARRSAGTLSTQRPEGLSPAKRMSPIEALKKAAAADMSLRCEASHGGKASDGKQSRPEARSESSAAEAGSSAIPPPARSSHEPNSGASAPESRAEIPPPQAHVSPPESDREASQPALKRAPRTPKR